MNNAYAFADSFKDKFKDSFKDAFDYNKVFSASRRNMEAFSAANQTLVEAAQAISRRQAEVARETMEELLHASRDLITSGTPETNVAKQAEYAKSWFENAVSNAREITEMATKACFEATDVISSQASKSLEEAAPKAKRSSK